MSASSRDAHRSLLDGLAAPDLDFRLTPTRRTPLVRSVRASRTRSKRRVRRPSKAAAAHET